MARTAKKPRVYITGRQKTAAEVLVAKGGSISNAMRIAGYSENTLQTPQKLTESRGFLALCDDMGLTDQFLVSALQEDIKVKKANRKPELELAFKIRGRLKENPETNVFSPIIQNIEYIVPKDGSTKP